MPFNISALVCGAKLSLKSSQGKIYRMIHRDQNAESRRNPFSRISGLVPFCVVREAISQPKWAHLSKWVLARTFRVGQKKQTCERRVLARRPLTKREGKNDAGSRYKRVPLKKWVLAPSSRKKRLKEDILLVAFCALFEGRLGQKGHLRKAGSGDKAFEHLRLLSLNLASCCLK